MLSQLSVHMPMECIILSVVKRSVRIKSGKIKSGKVCVIGARMTQIQGKNPVAFELAKSNNAKV